MVGSVLLSPASSHRRDALDLLTVYERADCRVPNSTIELHKFDSYFHNMWGNFNKIVKVGVQVKDASQS